MAVHTSFFIKIMHVPILLVELQTFSKKQALMCAVTIPFLGFNPHRVSVEYYEELLADIDSHLIGA